MFKALTTIALLVGSSSAALAQPVNYTRAPRGGVTVRDHRDIDGRWEREREREARERREREERERREHEEREHERRFDVQPWFQASFPVYEQPVYQAPVASSWMSLMAPTTIGVDGRAFVSINSQPGALHALRLDASSGDTFVSSVAIEYTDGRTQVVTVGQELEPSNPSYEVALDSTCGIEDVTINGRSEYGGSIALAAL